MHECEFPDHPVYTGKRIFDGENRDMRRTIKIVCGPDAPRFLQMNWNNIVLWRMTMRYPQGSVGGKPHGGVGVE